MSQKWKSILIYLSQYGFFEAHEAWKPVLALGTMLCAMDLENREKSVNSTLVKEKSVKLWFACGVLPQFVTVTK